MSQKVHISTYQLPFAKVRSSNSSDSSFASKIPTTTKPTGAGVFSVDGNNVLLVFFGTGNNNDTFNARLIGWRQLGKSSTSQNTLWVPVVLCEWACTLSATVGVAGTAVDATNRFVDTLSLTTGNDDVSVEQISPTGDVLAHAVADIKGFELLEITFDMVSATDGNALYSGV